MDRDTLEWELRQLEAGSELLIVDALRRPVARGILRDDRKGLSGANGEYFPFEHWDPAWQLTVLKRRESGPRRAPPAR